MKIIDLKQNTHEWLAHRKTGIGASDAPIIMRKSPWTTPYGLWERKTGRAPEQEMNSAMRRGHELEPEARDAYQTATNIDIKPVYAESSDVPFIHASLDGWNEALAIPVEIKCPGETDHKLALMGKVPEKYLYQVQQQIFVTRSEVLHYFSYHPMGPALVEVRRNEDLINELVKEEKKFWDLVQNDIPPELVDKDYVEVTDPLSLQLAEQYRIRKMQIELLEEAQIKDRQHLLNMASGRRISCGRLRIMSYPVKGNIQYKNIPELQSVDLEKYRAETRIQPKILVKD